MHTQNFLKRFIISLLIFFVAMIALKIFLDQRTESLTQQKYLIASQEVISTLKTLIASKEEQTMLAALSLAQSSQLKEALVSGDFSDISYDQYLRSVKSGTPLQNPWLHIISTEGKSLYRSWSDKHGDSLYYKRADIPEIIRTQKPMQTISVGIFDMTFKAMVPIYDQERFIGIFEVITKFNSIAEKIKEKGWNPVFLVNERFKKQLQYPFTKRFLKNFYVANLNASDAALSFIESRQLFHYGQLSPYFADKKRNQFVVFYDLKDIQNQPLGHFFILQPLDNIEINSFIKEQRNIYVYVILIYLIGMAIYFNSFNRRQAKQIEAFSLRLASEVDQKTTEIQQQKQFLQATIDGVIESLKVYDNNGKIILQNDSARKLNQQGIFRNPSDETSDCSNQDIFETKNNCKTVIKFNGMTSTPEYYEYTVSPLFNEQGQITNIIELGHNITQHLLTQEQLNKQKQDLDFIYNHDPLTNLPNRNLFLKRIDEIIEESNNAKNLVAVLIIDLDRFKEINESFGHQSGDSVLIECADRLLHQATHIDTLARLGGDEFGILLDCMQTEQEIIEITEELVKSFEKPIFLNGHIFHITASIGVSLFPTDASLAQELIQNADAALYKAKDSGRNTYHFYTKEMTERAFERILLENSLRAAIKEQQLEVYYQPQIDIKNESVIGFEALVRWNHPQMGLISPDKFIPLAEETGLIIPLGEQVMKMAMATIADWRSKKLTNGRMAINVSAKQLQTGDCLHAFQQIIEETGCAPEWLELEVTESALMQNKEASIQILNELKNLGVKISLDDFGTGYSSLSHLKELPVNKVKIDQSFIRNLPDDENDLEITKAIIAMTKSLNMDVIAEGIETETQKNVISAEGCHHVQGYMYYRPDTLQKIEALLVEIKSN